MRYAPKQLHDEVKADLMYAERLTKSPPFAERLSRMVRAGATTPDTIPELAKAARKRLLMQHAALSGLSFSAVIAW